MRIVFFGTPDIAALALEALAGSRHAVAAVVTQPDRPKGRSKKPAPPPVKISAEKLGLEVFQPENVNSPDAIAYVKNKNPEALVVVAFGQIFKRQFFDAAPKYILNLHASLLPKYRGANPIAMAILSGDKTAGVSVMQIVDKIDAGPVYLKKEIPIAADDTTATLTEKLAALGGPALVEALDAVEKGAAPVPQDESAATYAPQFEKSDGLVEWAEDAALIERKIRAFHPWPGAFTFLKSNCCRFKILGAETAPGTGEPGTVLAADEKGILIAAGSGAVLVKKLQAEGRSACGASEFCRGTKIHPGDSFGKQQNQR